MSIGHSSGCDDHFWQVGTHKSMVRQLPMTPMTVLAYEAGTTSI